MGEIEKFNQKLKEYEEKLEKYEKMEKFIDCYRPCAKKFCAKACEEKQNENKWNEDKCRIRSNQRCMHRCTRGNNYKRKKVVKKKKTSRQSRCKNIKRSNKP